MNLTVVIPTLNEATNLAVLLPKLKQILDGMALSDGYEILIIDGPSTDGTEQAARQHEVRYHRQQGIGYGGALREAFALSQGEYVVTIDADLSHNPYVIKQLYKQRQHAEVIIASRYVRAGFARTEFFRKIFSRLLNKIFCYILDIPLHDISSGFRLYRRDALREVELTATGYELLEEIIVEAYMRGIRVMEIPFHYAPRKRGKSHVKLIKFAWAYLTMLSRLWVRRNSIRSADYDERAFHSKILIQRYWQRKRYAHILDLIDNREALVDIGCGSSKILGAIPQAVAMDVSFNKLRHLRILPNSLVNGTIFALPFKDERFDEIICSQVIEHIPPDDTLFAELRRILRDDGTLVIGTPDYATWRWRWIEWVYKRAIPGGYADEHITHYTFDSLVKKLNEYGFTYLAHRYVAGAELIIKARKGGAQEHAQTG